MFSFTTFTTITFPDGKRGHFDGNFVYLGDPFIENAIYSVNDDEEIYTHPVAKYAGNFEGSRARDVKGKTLFTCDQDLDRV